MRCTTTRSIRRGQAMVEFLILAAGVILPFLLLMPVLSSYQDVRHQTQLASRYVAMEARSQSDRDANWKALPAVQTEVQARFFEDQNQAIISNPSAVGGGAPQWGDGTGQRLMPNPAAAVQVRTGASADGQTVAEGFNRAVDPYGSTAYDNNMPPKRLGLETRGTYSATVQATLNPLPAAVTGWFGKTFAPMDETSWTVKARTVLLTAPWTAADPDQVMANMATREGDVFAWPFPTQGLASPNPYTDYTTANVDKVLNKVELDQFKKGPQLGILENWRDVVPTDRLKP